MTNRITAEHLKRAAIVYVRQSGPEQVRSHAESTRIQVGLREKAVAFGWGTPVTIMDDLGLSAAGFAQWAHHETEDGDGRRAGQQGEDEAPRAADDAERDGSREEVVGAAPSAPLTGAHCRTIVGHVVGRRRSPWPQPKPSTSWGGGRHEVE